MGFLDAENESLLSKYMRDLKRWPVLSPEESTKLFKEMEEGSTSARRKIINSNLRLVISVAKGYSTKGIPMDDIIQEGNIGLMRAVERFDWKRGYRFSTYAIWWIRQAIGQHLTKNKRIVRMPAHIVGLCKKMKTAMEEDENMTLAELSSATGASTRLVKAANDASGSIVSLDAPRKAGASAGGEFEQRWIDVLADASLGSNPAECISEKQLVQIVRKVMNEQLSPKESVVLRLRYGLTDDPSDAVSYPLTNDLGDAYETEEETDLFDGDGSGWDGIQEDYGDSSPAGMEDELLLGEELALEGDEEDGSGVEPGYGSPSDGNADRGNG